MIHFADLQHRLYRGGLGLTNYVIYVDAFDPLIAAGWQIVPVPEMPVQTGCEQEPRTREEAAEEEELEDSPSKKRKLAQAYAIVNGKAKEGGDRDEHGEWGVTASLPRLRIKQGDPWDEEDDVGWH